MLDGKLSTEEGEEVYAYLGEPKLNHIEVQTISKEIELALSDDSLDITSFMEKRIFFNPFTSDFQEAYDSSCRDSRLHVLEILNSPTTRMFECDP